MSVEQTANVHCPYCGEQIALRIETTEGSHAYIEDCSVCCRPMNVSVVIDMNGDPFVTLTREDD